MPLLGSLVRWLGVAFLAGGVAAATAAADVHALGGSSPPKGTIASGMFGRIAWRLSATDAADGSFCVTVKLSLHSSGGATACGSIYGPRAHGITYLAHTGGPEPDYIVGPVVATARTVEITLSNGATLRTKTIAPPKGMTTKIAFYVAQLPCPATPTRLEGVDRLGHIRASLPFAAGRMPGRTTC